MAALQGMLPIGIVVGYAITISLGQYWYCAFVIQAMFLLCLLLLFLTLPNYLDINKQALIRHNSIAPDDVVINVSLESLEREGGFFGEVNHFKSVGTD